MTDLQTARFFTPPRLTSLDLDLASLTGGGWAPAQYSGETPDGRDVFCRYRGGRLSVTVANEPGADVLRNGTCLLEERIGPPLHGGLSLGQLCHYAGITIKGARPAMPRGAELRRQGYEDLSGATTFYDFRVDSTLETARFSLARVMREIAELSVVQRLFDDKHRTVGGVFCASSEAVTSTFAYLILGERPPEDRLARLSDDVDLQALSPNSTVCRFDFPGFEYGLHPYSAVFTKRIAEQIGRKLRVAGQVDDCLHLGLWVQSSFANDDVENHARVLELDRILAACFPLQDLLCFELQSARRRPELDLTAMIDPAIAKWVCGGEDRWLHVLDNGGPDAPDYLGYRLHSKV